MFIIIVLDIIICHIICLTYNIMLYLGDPKLEYICIIDSVTIIIIIIVTIINSVPSR